MITKRRVEAELMDQPGLDPGLHVEALRGLQRINAISRSAAILWPPIAELARTLAPTKLRVLDVACGGGDNAVALSRRVARSGLSIQVDGCDVSDCAIAEAQRRAHAAHVENTAFFCLDAVQEQLPRGYDVITCSLFLHHLSEDQAIDLLGRMAEAASHAVLICDLQRSWLGYGLAWVGCRLLTRSPIVHVDGPRSVAAAFAAVEISSLAARSGLDGAVITHHWPQRWLLAWSKQ
jgi:2-polyprenyl-3-methyl-5-hydroxy-6-metoxy-1,4-benzoquinol methylase